MGHNSQLDQILGPTFTARAFPAPSIPLLSAGGPAGVHKDVFPADAAVEGLLELLPSAGSSDDSEKDLAADGKSLEPAIGTRAAVLQDGAGSEQSQAPLQESAQNRGLASYEHAALSQPIVRNAAGHAWQ